MAFLSTYQTWCQRNSPGSAAWTACEPVTVGFPATLAVTSLSGPSIDAAVKTPLMWMMVTVSQRVLVSLNVDIRRRKICIVATGALHQSKLLQINFSWVRVPCSYDPVVLTSLLFRHAICKIIALTDKISSLPAHIGAELYGYLQS